MANVSHASLTGSNLHEPKGADTASLGTVYVSNGAGSGSWSSVGTSSFTGMIADFAAPIAPTGWLELDGSIISTTTYNALYSVMSIQTTGTRASGSAVVTSIPSTTGIKAGYFVFGTGIASGTTVLSVDSSTQITLSANASSSISGTFAISPWLLNTGTIQLPDFTTAGRYRRSRSSTTNVGQVQADQNQAHTHTVSVTGSTDSQGAHSHTANVSDPTHTHQGLSQSGQLVTSGNGTAGQGANGLTSTSAASTGISVSIVSNGAHTHSVTASGTTASTGSTEARPLTMIVLTCVKT